MHLQAISLVLIIITTPTTGEISTGEQTGNNGHFRRNFYRLHGPTNRVKAMKVKMVAKI